MEGVQKLFFSEPSAINSTQSINLNNTAFIERKRRQRPDCFIWLPVSVIPTKKTLFGLVCLLLNGKKIVPRALSSAQLHDEGQCTAETLRSLLMCSSEVAEQ